MSRKFIVPLLTAAFLAASGLALTADRAAAGVNYNTSKSNTGNITFKPGGNTPNNVKVTPPKAPTVAVPHH
jgi:hypothetical protein